MLRLPIRSVLLFSAVCSTAAFAQPVSAPRPKPHKVFLWKVQSKTTTVWLLGSIHAARKELYPLDDRINNAFEESDKLVLEIAMDPKTQMQAAFKLLAAGRYPAGDGLSKHLDEKTNKLLAAHLKKAKMPEKSYEQFRPWLVSIMVTMQQLQKGGFNPADGIDLHFQKRAQKAGKPVLGLEKVDDQVNMFKDMSDELQAKMLAESLQGSGKAASQLDKVFHAWLHGDAETIDETLIAQMRTEEYKPLFKKIFTDRNHNMTKGILQFLKTKNTYFVVVGAGHLIGEDGIVELLQAKGFVPVQQ